MGIWQRSRIMHRIDRISSAKLAAEKKPGRTILERAANFGTIVASIVAISALGFGFHQFRATQILTRQTLELQQKVFRHERESKAIELTLKFNEIQHQMAASSRRLTEEALYWQRNFLVTITEAVFELMEDDPQWMATVSFLLQEQSTSLKKDGLQCRTFAPTFVAFANKTLGFNVCR